MKSKYLYDLLGEMNYCCCGILAKRETILATDCPVHGITALIYGVGVEFPLTDDDRERNMRLTGCSCRQYAGDDPECKLHHMVVKSTQGVFGITAVCCGVEFKKELYQNYHAALGDHTASISYLKAALRDGKAHYWARVDNDIDFFKDLDDAFYWASRQLIERTHKK